MVSHPVSDVSACSQCLVPYGSDQGQVPPWQLSPFDLDLHTVPYRSDQHFFTLSDKTLNAITAITMRHSRRTFLGRCLYFIDGFVRPLILIGGLIAVIGLLYVIWSMAVYKGLEARLYFSEWLAIISVTLTTIPYLERVASKF